MAPWGPLSGSVGGNTGPGNSVPPVSGAAPTASATITNDLGPWPLVVEITDTSTNAVNISKAYWDFGDGSARRTWTSGEVFTHTYTSAGNFSLVLSLTNDFGNSTINYDVDASNVSAPVAQITAEEVEFVPSVSYTTEFTITVDEGDDVTAFLAFGDGSGTVVEVEAGGADALVEHTYLAVGVYTPTLTVTNSQHTITESLTVTFNGPPEASFYYELFPDPVLGSRVSITNTTDGVMTSATINFGDGYSSAIGAGEVISHRYSATLAGSSPTLQLTAVGPGGTDTATTTVTLPLAVNPTISMLVTVTSGPTALGGAAVSATVTLSGFMTSAELDFGNGVIIPLSIPADPFSTDPVTSRVYTTTYDPNSDGTADTYTITASCEGSVGTIAQAQTLVIPPIPAPTAEFSFSIGTTQANGTTPVTFVFAPVGTVSSATFDTNNGQVLATGLTTAGTLVINYPNSGTFTVVYTVTGPGGASTKTVPITINTAVPIADFALSASSITPTSTAGTVTVTLTNQSNLINAITATYIIDWDDGTTQSLSSLTSVTHSYPGTPSGARSIELSVTTSGGTTAITRTLTVVKIVPQVTIAVAEGTYNSSTGLLATLTLSNNSSELTTQTVNWGDGSAPASTIGQTVHTHTYAAGSYGTKTITVASINSAGTDTDTYTVIGLPLTPPIAPPVSPTLIPFEVINGAQYAITDEPVSVSIPFFAADGFLNTSTFNVLGTSDVAIPAAYKVLSRWGGLRDDVTKPIKLVQATFLATVAASGTAGIGARSTYKLQTNATSQVAGSMIISSTQYGFNIKTGDAGGCVMDIAKNKFALLNGAWMGGGAQQILYNATAADALAYRSKQGRSLSGFTTISPPTGSVVSTVLEEGAVGSGQIKAVIRQTLTLTTGAVIVCRWTFVHKQPEAQIEFTLRNPKRFHDAGLGVSTHNQWVGNAFDPQGTDTYAEFIQYLRLGCNLPAAGFSTIRVGSFASSAVDFRNRTINYTTLSSGQTYRLQQYFRNYKRRLPPFDLAGTNTGDPDPGNLVYYKEGVTTSYTKYEGRPNSTEAVTSETGIGPINSSNFASDPESGRYPGGWVVDNGAGVGMIVTADTFWERSPKRFEVDKDTKTVKFDVFPEALPGDTSHFERGRTIGYYKDGTLYAPYVIPPTSAIGVQMLPAGTNPNTGLPYVSGDGVPTQFPDRGAITPNEAKPGFNGTSNSQISSGGAWRWQFVTGSSGSGFWKLNGSYPATSSHPDMDAAYAVVGGSWVIQRMRLRFFNSAPTSDVVKARVDLTRNQPIGLASPTRYKDTVALTPMPWDTPATTAASWDLDRGERMMKNMVDASPTGTDPTSKSQTSYATSTLRSFLNLGGSNPGMKPSNAPIRAVGWDVWGNAYCSDGWTNLSYDTPRWTLLQFVRTLDYRYFALSKQVAEWQMTRGFIKTADCFDPLGGYAYFEKGVDAPGYGGTPAASHCWLGGSCLAYALTGGESYVDSLYYVIPAFAKKNPPDLGATRNPVLWSSNEYYERNWAHAMHDLMFIHTVLGPVNAKDAAVAIYRSAYSTPPNTAVPADGNTTSKTLLQIIQDGFQNYDDLQSGAKLVNRTIGFVPSTFLKCNAPANFIPLSVTNANGGVTTTYCTGTADPTLTVVASTRTFDGTLTSSANYAPSTFQLAGRDYSNNGFILYKSESSSAAPAWHTKSYMLLYAIEAMYMLTVVDPTGPKTAKAKQLLRKCINYWYTHHFVVSGPGTVKAVAYYSAPKDRVEAAWTVRPLANNGLNQYPYILATQYGNQWMPECSVWLPAGTTPPIAATDPSSDNFHLNTIAPALGVLAFTGDTVYSTPEERQNDQDNLKLATRVAVRYTNGESGHNLTGRAVGASKSVTPSDTPYDAYGLPKKMYTAPTGYLFVVSSDATAITPVDFVTMTGSNAVKSIGQSVYRGVLYAVAAAKKAGIEGTI